LTTIYATPSAEINPADVGSKITASYESAYAGEPFVRLLSGKALPDTKNVVGTNVVEIAWRFDPRTGRVVIMSAEDNLIKGASGQAVQSMKHHVRLPRNNRLL
jgi:N-acetyl-gamma-glutamyl-phosphate reductase